MNNAWPIRLIEIASDNPPTVLIYIYISAMRAMFVLCVTCVNVCGYLVRVWSRSYRVNDVREVIVLQIATKSAYEYVYSSKYRGRSNAQSHVIDWSLDAVWWNQLQIFADEKALDALARHSLGCVVANARRLTWNKIAQSIETHNAIRKRQGENGCDRYVRWLERRNGDGRRKIAARRRDRIVTKTKCESWMLRFALSARLIYPPRA